MRRQFGRLSALTGAALFLLSCAPADSVDIERVSRPPQRNRTANDKAQAEQRDNIELVLGHLVWGRRMAWLAINRPAADFKDGCIDYRARNGQTFLKAVYGADCNEVIQLPNQRKIRVELRGTARFTENAADRSVTVEAELEMSVSDLATPRSPQRRFTIERSLVLAEPRETSGPVLRYDFELESSLEPAKADDKLERWKIQATEGTFMVRASAEGAASAKQVTAFDQGGQFMMGFRIPRAVEGSDKIEVNEGTLVLDNPAPITFADACGAPLGVFNFTVSSRAGKNSGTVKTDADGILHSGIEKPKPWPDCPKRNGFIDATELSGFQEIPPDLSSRLSN